MAAERRASVTWTGDLLSGSGTIDEVGSGAFGPLDVSWAARAEETSGGKTSPEELIASNGATSTIESLGTLVGPVSAGVLVAFADVGVVFTVAAAAMVIAAALLARVRVEGRIDLTANADDESAQEMIAAGFRTFADTPGARLIVGLIAAQTFVRGCVNVLIVVAVAVVATAGLAWALLRESPASGAPVVRVAIELPRASAFLTSPPGRLPSHLRAIAWSTLRRDLRVFAPSSGARANSVDVCSTCRGRGATWRSRPTVAGWRTRSAAATRS